MVLIFAVIFWIGLYVVDYIFKLRKKGWEIQPGLLMAKTKRLNNVMDSIARVSPKVWRWIWTGGIFVGFFAMGLIVVLLTWNLFNPFGGLASASPAATSATVPLIPGITISFELFLWLIIPIIIIMITHEMAHGIAARVERIKLRSSGIIVFLIFFGAFVEPDEKTLEEKSPVKRMRVLAAGSVTNLLVGFFCLMLLSNSLFFLSPFYSPTPSAVVLQQINTDSPLYNQLIPGSIITSINGTQIASYDDLDAYMLTTEPFETVTLTYYLFFPYTLVPSQSSIRLGDKITDLESPASSSNQNISSYELLNGSSTSSYEDLTNNGNLFNITGNLTHGNYSRLDCRINLYELGVVPSSMNLSMNAFLNTTNNITLANLSIINKNGSKENVAEFNTTNQNYVMLEYLTAQNISNYIHATNEMILRFEVNSTSQDYNASIGYISINVTYSQRYIGLMGIFTSNFYLPTFPLGFLVLLFGPLFESAIVKTILYTFLLGVVIGLFNLLPIPPFDGDGLLTGLVEWVSGGKKKRVIKKTQDDEEVESWEWSRNQKIVIWSVRIFSLAVLVLSITLTIIFMLLGLFDLSIFFP